MSIYIVYCSCCIFRVKINPLNTNIKNYQMLFLIFFIIKGNKILSKLRLCLISAGIAMFSIRYRPRDCVMGNIMSHPHANFFFENFPIFSAVGVGDNCPIKNPIVLNTECLLSNWTKTMQIIFTHFLWVTVKTTSGEWKNCNSQIGTQGVNVAYSYAAHMSIRHKNVIEH